MACEASRISLRLAPYFKVRVPHKVFWSALGGLSGGASASTSRSACMARVFLLALWMAPSAASATRMGSLSLARQPVRPAVLRRPIVLRRTTVLTSSLQDQQTFRAIIDDGLRKQAAFIQQLPADGAISVGDARMLKSHERVLNAWRHALEALSNPGSKHQTVNDVWINLQDQQLFRTSIDLLAQQQAAIIQHLPVDGAISRDDALMLDALERALNSNRHALDALSNYVNDSWIGRNGGALLTYFCGLDAWIVQRSVNDSSIGRNAIVALVLDVRRFGRAFVCLSVCLTYLDVDYDA